MVRRSSQYAQLILVCRRRGVPHEVAREIVQEAHLRMFEYQLHTKVRDPDSLLRRVVINLSINYYHRERRRFVQIDTVQVVDPKPSLERVVIGEQELARVIGDLGKKSPRVCQVFFAHRIGYGYDEIAVAAGIKPRTVERHIWMAYEIMKDLGISEP